MHKTLAVVMLGLATCSAVRAEDQAGPKIVSLSIQPSSLVLDHARDSRRVVVLGVTEAGTTVDLSATAQFTTDSSVVRMTSQGIFEPVAEGMAKVGVAVAGLKANLPIAVRSTETPPV